MTSAFPAMPTDLRLAPRQVHLFLSSTDLPHAKVEEYESFLTPEEKERFGRLRIPAKRTETVISRGVLRKILGNFLRTPPQKIAFSTGSHGKPYLAGNPLHFNLSHTAGQVVVAVSGKEGGGEVGVDIESLKREGSYEELAGRFFTKAEHAALLKLPPEEQAKAFLRCWTRKEALLKAVGRGIAGGLDSFEVPVGNVEMPVRVAEWNLHDLTLSPGYVGALATGIDGAELHYWAGG